MKKVGGTIIRHYGALVKDVSPSIAGLAYFGYNLEQGSIWARGRTIGMRRLALVGSVLLLLILSACSGTPSSNPTIPQLPENDLAPAAMVEMIAPGHSLLGYFFVTVDPATSEVAAVPLRGAAQHLNALRFVEPPSGGSTVSFSNVSVDGQLISLDISILHPLAGQQHYCGFDVKGIIIGKADTTDPTDPSRSWGAGSDSLRLLNADGWTRWWNPLEFPDNGTAWSYQDGIYGTPKAQYAYNSTLLGYKLFASSLESDEEDLLHLLDYPKEHPKGRATFHAGTQLTRHYDIWFPDNGSGGPQIIFNYAIDACHGFPPDYQPGEFIEVPGGFPPEANQLEPFFVGAEVTENTLYLTSLGCVGGSLRLHIKLSDWQALIKETPVSEQVQSIEITSPLLFNGTREPVLVADLTDSEGYAIYEIILEGLTPDSLLDQQVLVTVCSSDGDYQPEKTLYTGSAPLSSYYVIPVSVDDIGPPSGAGFALNPLAPWPKPGGNSHNSNTSIIVGPSDPHVAWQRSGLSHDTSPLVDPEGRVFVYEEGPGEGITLLVIGSDGLPLAEMEFPEFDPDGDPIMVGCSLMWIDVESNVYRLYQNGDLAFTYQPIPGGYEAYDLLNIDDGRAFIHGPSGIQAFNSHGANLWYYFSDDIVMFIGPSAVTGQGLIVLGKVDIDGSPFITDFLAFNPANGKVMWTHTPDFSVGIANGAAADPLTGNVYYAIANYIAAIDGDGNALWHREFAHTVRETIAIGPDGTVYTAETLYGGTGEEPPWYVMALSPDNDELWSYPCEKPVFAGPIVDSVGFLYFVNYLVGSNEIEVRCLYPSGDLRWVRVLSGSPAYLTFGPPESVLVGFYETQGTTSIVCLKD